jgi:hypothetical protein
VHGISAVANGIMLLLLFVAAAVCCCCCCSHVFLLEPCLNPALEEQAIGELLLVPTIDKQ